MITTLALVGAIALWSLAPVRALEPDPCRLITPGEISSALGASPGPGAIDGPITEQATSSQTWHCTMELGSRYLSIGVTEFRSAADAVKGRSKALTEAQDVISTMTPTPTPEIGEYSAWGASTEGAMWVVFKGKHLLTITLAGALTNPAGYRDPLKRLATAALAKLGA